MYSTHRLRVERRAGGGTPPPPCRKTRKWRNPTASVERRGGGGMPPCRMTWRWRNSNTSMSKDAEAEGPQRLRVERHRGGGNNDDWDVEQSHLALFFVFNSFNVSTYRPKEDYPSLGTIYSFTTILYDTQPVKRSKVKFGRL